MFDELVGARLLGVSLPDDENLIFHTAVGDYHYIAYGDCCSESWVESISGNLHAVNDAMVVSVEEKYLQDQPGTRQESDDVSFVTIVTTKGHFDIEFRNSSNGYYGGYMYLKTG